MYYIFYLCSLKIFQAWKRRKTAATEVLLGCTIFCDNQFERHSSLGILRTLVFHVDAPNHSIARMMILSYLMKIFLKRKTDFQGLIVIFYTKKPCYNITNSLCTNREPGCLTVSREFSSAKPIYVWDQNRCKASAMFPNSCLKSDPLTFKNNLTLLMNFSKRKEWTLLQNKRKCSCHQLFRNKIWRKYENVN